MEQENQCPNTADQISPFIMYQNLAIPWHCGGPMTPRFLVPRCPLQNFLYKPLPACYSPFVIVNTCLYPSECHHQTFTPCQPPCSMHYSNSEVGSILPFKNPQPVPPSPTTDMKNDERVDSETAKEDEKNWQTNFVKHQQNNEDCAAFIEANKLIEETGETFHPKEVTIQKDWEIIENFEKELAQLLQQGDDDSSCDEVKGLSVIKEEIEEDTSDFSGLTTNFELDEMGDHLQSFLALSGDFENFDAPDGFAEHLATNFEPDDHHQGNEMDKNFSSPYSLTEYFGEFDDKLINFKPTTHEISQDQHNINDKLNGLQVCKESDSSEKWYEITKIVQRVDVAIQFPEDGILKNIWVAANPHCLCSHHTQYHEMIQLPLQSIHDDEKSENFQGVKNTVLKFENKQSAPKVTKDSEITQVAKVKNNQKIASENSLKTKREVKKARSVESLEKQSTSIPVRHISLNRKEVKMESKKSSKGPKVLPRWAI